ncbi:MAG: UDP-2,4-diacetamido-2,4,6-trideoxy-beta-L-altropyranose hydrolase [Balneolaceae bacterium]|nr:UDP-2,4-diacetamido-2,4,6-trideoxy-beta-L-altropyranose hydrolase [Balneolaceae bacterium]
MSEVRIRVDGNNQFGLGHLVRCTALAQMLKNHFSITFYLKEVPEQIRLEIEKKHFQTTLIDSEKNFLKELTPDMTVVLDGYHFNTGYQKKIKEIGSNLVCIDDVYDKEFYADLIINHAPGITTKDYSAQPYTRFALGPDYVLLRPSFLSVGNPKKGVDKHEKILICFGGSDSANLTLRVINIVLDFNQFKKIFIITGSAYKFEKELLETIKNTTRIEYFHAVDQQKMAALMNKADAAIVPASGILFEVLATGTTAISGMYTDNQKNVYSGFKKMNAFIDAGTFQVQQIEKAIKNLGDFKNPTIIDGKSPERLLKLFQSLK